MGLIRAAVGSVAGTLHDQWKEAIRCEDMGNDILMKKVTTKNGVISNGSTVIVGPGQCAVIYDNGRIIDATAEEGFFTFDSSSTPSFFAGQFGEVFEEMWLRFSYGGGTSKEQAVYYFNLKEIIGNKFGTQEPVAFQDWSHSIKSQVTGEDVPMSVYVRCHGLYTFQIINPSLFMSRFAGTAEELRKEELAEQMRAEVLETFQNLLNGLGSDEYKFPVLQLRQKTDEIKRIMHEKEFDKPIRERGIAIIGFVIESLGLNEESQEKINNWELSQASYIQQGNLVGAYSQAIKDAANNPGGAANGFMGIGMMNMATGGVTGGAATGPWQNNNNNVNPTQTQQQPASNNTWECPNCKKQASGKFCQECGTPRPEKAFCPNCGAEVKKGTKFCSECGSKIGE